MNESSNKFIFNILGIIVALIIIIALWNQRNFEVERIIKENQGETIRLISEKIKKEYRLDNGKPFILYPQQDSTLSKNQIDSIQSKIGKILRTDFEMLNDSLLNMDDFAPFYIFPNKPQKDLSIQLSSKDLENMKRHFEFIQSELDYSLNQANQDLNNALQSLDNRLTIWIGVLGLLGIFIPIFLQFQTTSSTERILDEKINLIKESHNKLDGNIKKMDADVNNLISQYPALKESAEKATKKTLELENLIFLIHKLGRIRSLDINKTQFVKNKEQYFVLELEKIENSLNQIIEDEIFDVDFIKEDLNDFYYSMNSFKYFFSNRNITENIEHFITKLKVILNSGEINIKEIKEVLKNLIIKLKE